VTAAVLSGRELADRIRADVRNRARALRERDIVPRCAVFAAEGDAEGIYYAESLSKVGLKTDVDVGLVVIPSKAGTAGFAAAVAGASTDPLIHGILVQRPLPAPFDRRRVCDAIVVGKDVDASNPYSFGLLAQGTPAFAPATAAAVLELARSRSVVPLAGASVVVVGRSPVVGRPVALLLSVADATVTLCHSRTRDLASVCARADILVAAIGKPRFIGAAHVKPGATVIDVGINFVDGRMVGDVDFDAVSEIAGAVSPVPGGVGPVTTSILLRHVIEAAEKLNAP
jgi:methylenetetrahydrofolate dehydrogenase (NADP+) / methenyltetrahydrofolate cyclohydrolase